jgi:hypothetical protein
MLAVGSELDLQQTRFGVRMARGPDLDAKLARLYTRGVEYGQPTGLVI